MITAQQAIYKEVKRKKSKTDLKFIYPVSYKLLRTTIVPIETESLICPALSLTANFTFKVSDSFDGGVVAGIELSGLMADKID